MNNDTKVQARMADLQMGEVADDSLEQTFTLTLITDVGPATYELGIGAATFLYLSTQSVIKAATAAVKRQHPEKFPQMGGPDGD